MFLAKTDKSKTSKQILIWSLILFFTIVLVIPILIIFLKAMFNGDQFVGFNNFIEYFSTPALVQSFKNSMLVSTVTSIICVVLAFGFAYGVERSNIKFKGVLNFIAGLPLLIPTMTYAIALIYLFGENGLITTGFFGKIPFLDFKFPLYGQWGIILAECFYVFPALYIMFTIALKTCDFRLYEAADVLGTSKFRIFRTITIPSVKYTLVSAFFSGFTMVFSDFGVPKVLGGNYNLLATDIYKQVIGQSNINIGATIGIVLILPSIISFIFDRKFSKGSNSVDSSAKDFKVLEDKTRDIICGIITYTVSIFIILIFTAIFLAAFTEQWPYNLNFTFKWFTINSVGLSPITLFINTIFVSLISAILGTCAVILTAYVTQRGTGFDKVRKFLDWFGMLPLAIPGLVIGLAYLLFFNYKGNPLNVIYGTFIIMIFANIIHFFSIPYITMKTSMKKIDSEYENVSETMGIPWYFVFDNVILDIIKPAVLESFIYYFVNSMMTISALIFLYTTKTKVASVEMVATYDEGIVASTAAIAVMIFVINLIVKYLVINYNRKLDRESKYKNEELLDLLKLINESENKSVDRMARKLSLSTFKTRSLIKRARKENLLIKDKSSNEVVYEITDKGFELLRENLEEYKESKISITESKEKSFIKTAVILAAGRRNEFDLPVALLEGENRKTIIENSIDNLIANNISRIIVVVGYEKEKIKECLNSYKEVEFVDSSTFEGTGSMDSLALINNKIDEDFILLEGDLIFDKEILKELLKSNKKDAILVTNITDSGDEEFVQLKNGELFKLGKDIHQFNRVDGEFMGISKISNKLFKLIVREYKENLNPLLNYEYILLDIARDFRISGIIINNKKWSEIDNKSQYNRFMNDFYINIK